LLRAFHISVNSSASQCMPPKRAIHVSQGSSADDRERS
jgi:hypothetical protein